MKKIYFLAAIILIVPILLMLAGCQTVAPMVTAPRNDSIIIRHHYEHDSIYVQDSMAVALVHDTVYINRWRTKDRFSIVQRTDTIYQDKEVVVTMPPEKYVPSFYKWCTGLFIGLIILLLLYVAARIAIRIYAHR